LAYKESVAKLSTAIGLLLITLQRFLSLFSFLSHIFLFPSVINFLFVFNIFFFFFFYNV